VSSLADDAFSFITIVSSHPPIHPPQQALGRYGRKKKATGRVLEGPVHDAMPQQINSAA